MTEAETEVVQLKPAPVEYVKAAVGRIWTAEDADYITRMFRKVDSAVVDILQMLDKAREARKG